MKQPVNSSLVISVMCFLFLPTLLWGQATLLPGTAHLSIGKTPGEYSGSITVEGYEDECRVLLFKTKLTKYSGEMGSVAIDAESPGGIGSIDYNSEVTVRGGSAYGELWMTDIVYTMNGKVCLPAKWWDPVKTVLRLSYQSTEGGSMAMIDGRLRSNTPVLVSGMAAIRVPEELDVIEVDSSPDQPLSFVMTPDGLQYQGGNGIVIMAGGETLEF
ncbi:MAG: hypothetical protein GY947_14500 [Rhodobacteraceae bacterium]|nr:hypothetical protein [Paracoccaceae bacterium]